MGQGGGIPATGPSDMSLDAQPSTETTTSSEERRSSVLRNNTTI